MTWVYENVTERLDLESRYNALIHVQGETLDHLSEGVAVFGSDARLRLHNPSFAAIWSLDPELLAGSPHVADIVAACRRPGDDEAKWQRFTACVAGLDENRASVSGRMEHAEDWVIDYATVPLPDGQTMVTFVDVTDSVQVERALVDRNEALLAADSLKNAFIQHVSYELRSPLTNIIGFTQLMADAQVGPLNDKQREYTGYVMSSSMALLAIVNDILDLATIDAGIMELDLGEVDVIDAVSAVIEGLQDRVRETHVDLERDIPSDIGGFVADGKRVRQILFNLLANAIEFSEAGGHVRVSARRDGGMIELAVSDEGPGIPADFLEFVFDRFASRARSGGHGGAGLGLAIVKSLVALHHGTVDISSEEGRGATVTIRLPDAPAGRSRRGGRVRPAGPAGPVAAETLARTIDLADEAATIALAEDIAAILKPGDVVALSGGLGTGKTSLARALIRAVAGEPALEVPSPTFTLVQTYATPRLSLAHFDLYRIGGADELAEIGFEEAVAEGAVLVEWPERAGGLLPSERLDVTLEIAGTGRRAHLSGGSAWAPRLARSLAARAFLEAAGWSGATRRYLVGDASTRIYDRIADGDRRAVLMDWPTGRMLALDDPRARFRAHDVGAFLAVDEGLRALGLSAPEIHAVDRDAGFLLMEDLGTEGVVAGGAPIPERYALAIDVLAAIHAEPRPPVLPLPGGDTHPLIPLDAEALAPDIALFADWYVPHATGRPLGDEARAAFEALWAGLFARLGAGEQSWVLFDMQSPNLFWLPERQGLARLGIIDFQDMFLGPAAYDVAAICHDARATVPLALEADLRARYVAHRRAANSRFDAETFAESCAILAVARTLKNSWRLCPPRRQPGQARLFAAHAPPARLSCPILHRAGSVRPRALV